MNAIRLDSSYAGLANKYRRSSGRVRRHAALLAVERAVAAAGVVDTVALAVLADLRAGRGADRLLADQIGALAERVDEEYLALLNGGPEAVASARTTVAFSQARALFALFWLAKGTKLHEAIYESLMALEDPARLASELDDELAG